MPPQSSPAALYAVFVDWTNHDFCAGHPLPDDVDFVHENLGRIKCVVTRAIRAQRWQGALG